MIPKIIHLTTKDGKLNQAEQNVLENNKKILGNEYRIKIYSDNDNRKLIKEHFPEFLEKYDAITKGVVKADVIRYLYLYLYGGIYCDTDYMFLKKIPNGILAQTCIIPSERMDNNQYALGQCIMMGERKVNLFYDFIKSRLEQLPETFDNEEQILHFCGPAGLTKYYNKHINELDYVGMTNPYDYNPVCCYIDQNGNRGYRILKETIGIHLCFGGWRMENKNIYKPVTNIKIDLMN